MSQKAPKVPDLSKFIFCSRAGLISRADRRRIWIEDKVHLYTGPKGARFVPIFGKSADFVEKKFEG
jgi:hypothetical protein